MKVLKVIGIIILALIALFFIIAIFLPSKIMVEESVTINKHASLIYKQVNNFQNWPQWSPWDVKDPDIIHSYDGPEAGYGAINSWQSEKLGNGSMTISVSEPYTRIVTDLEFHGKDGGFAYFDFEGHPDGTKVTWGLEADASYPVERWIMLLMSGAMKEMFADGLNNLKELTEGMADPVVIGVVNIPELKAITVLDSCYWNEMEMKMGEMFGVLMAYAQRNGVEMAGPPFSHYTIWDEERQFTVFETGLPVSGEPSNSGRVEFKTFPATKAAKTTHLGSYEGFYDTYMALQEYVEEHGLEYAAGPFEIYITDPGNEPDTTKWQTEIYFPVK